MKVRYDARVDAAYIVLRPDDERAAFDFTYSCDQGEVGGEINIDFDVDGRIIGIEVLRASKMLHRSMIIK